MGSDELNNDRDRNASLLVIWEIFEIYTKYRYVSEMVQGGGYIV